MIVLPVESEATGEARLGRERAFDAEPATSGKYPSRENGSLEDTVHSAVVPEGELLKRLCGELKPLIGVGSAGGFRVFVIEGDKSSYRQNLKAFASLCGPHLGKLAWFMSATSFGK
jgi:hypothetical protein